MGAVSSVFDSASNLVSDVGSAISDVGVTIDQTVRHEIPGGWGTVGAVAAIASGMEPGSIFDASPTDIPTPDLSVNPDLQAPVGEPTITPPDVPTPDVPSPDLSANPDLQPPPEPTPPLSPPTPDVPPTPDITPNPGSDQYSLSGQTPSGPGIDPNLPSGSEMSMASLTGQAPSIADMGGGTGLTLPESTVLGDPTATGILSATGVTAADQLPSLGDPNSFVNTGQIPTSSTTSPLSNKLLTKAVSTLLGDQTTGGGSSSSGGGTNVSSSPSSPLGSSAYNPLTAGLLSTGTVLNKSPLEQSLGATEAPLEPVQLNQLYSQSPNPYMPQNISEGTPDIKFSKDGGSMGGLGHYEHKPEFVTGHTGYYAQGGGTGQSDDIPALLKDGDYVMDADIVAALGDGSNKAGAEALHHFMSQFPHKHYENHSQGGHINAMIADGEFVFPSSLVTALGGGSNKEGAKKLDEMREKIREHKRSASTNKIPPKAKSPLSYMEKK